MLYYRLLNESAQLDLQTQLYDAVIKRELDILQDNNLRTQPSNQFSPLPMQRHTSIQIPAPMDAFRTLCR